MRPWLVRWLTVVLSVTVLTLGAAASPRWLRRADAFRVKSVHVLGTRYLAPHDVLAASGITRAASVFDDPAPWRARLLRMPQVADASVERRLPATLIIRVTEAEPVALVRTPDLVPVTARGAVLPIAPGTADLDLPLIDIDSRIGADGRVATPQALALAATIERLRELDPGFAASVSEAQPGPDGSARLLLRSPALLEALLPADPTAASLRHLQTALQDVESRGELGRLRRLDARFVDQIVVAFTPQHP